MFAGASRILLVVVLAVASQSSSTSNTPPLSLLHDILNGENVYLALEGMPEIRLEAEPVHLIAGCNPRTLDVPFRAGDNFIELDAYSGFYRPPQNLPPHTPPSSLLMMVLRSLYVSNALRELTCKLMALDCDCDI